MEPLTVETFNPDMIKVTTWEQKKAGEINYTSVKFEYAGGKIPPLRINGKFRLFRFKNPRGDICSLSIRCNKENWSFFKRLCDIVANKSCRLVPNVNGKKLKPEDFELIKDNNIRCTIKIFRGGGGVVDGEGGSSEGCLKWGGGGGGH